MLKLAVVGAQTLLGRELVSALEPQDCSVLPLTTGPMTREDEEADLVVFAPTPELLKGLDAVILADDLQDPALLTAFSGRVLDLREGSDPKVEGMPLGGAWPSGVKTLRARGALEQVLALLPQLVTGLGEVAGTHLKGVAAFGDKGLEALMAQTVAVIQGEDPDTSVLGYRAAFEVSPQVARGSLMEVRVPVFHGDLLILHVRAGEGQKLVRRDAPPAVQWVSTPPSSRDVAVSSDLLAHLSLNAEGTTGMLTLGFDPILWGVLRPTLRVLGL